MVTSDLIAEEYKEDADIFYLSTGEIIKLFLSSFFYKKNFIYKKNKTKAKKRVRRNL